MADSERGCSGRALSPPRSAIRVAAGPARTGGKSSSGGKSGGKSSIFFPWEISPAGLTPGKVDDGRRGITGGCVGFGRGGMRSERGRGFTHLEGGVGGREGLGPPRGGLLLRRVRRESSKWLSRMSKGGKSTHIDALGLPSRMVRLDWFGVEVHVLFAGIIVAAFVFLVELHEADWSALICGENVLVEYDQFQVKRCVSNQMVKVPMTHWNKIVLKKI
jgi:hypothetical protein